MKIVRDFSERNLAWTNQASKPFGSLGPHCGVRNQAALNKKNEGRICYGYGINRVGAEYTCNGYKLYFITSHKGKLIWAYNRMHLQYLFDYITADIRQKPDYDNKGMAYHLPKYMHLAKNRDGIAKALRKMI
ncbi:MAG: hypothetical protein FWE21_09430 [Defluviitaleaceae bacterium]|nr:hypothetical protein [Defluviitaleaceae bacterium]